MTDPRQENFMADLQALLNKHDAELEVGDDGGEYGMQQGVCTIAFPSAPYRPHCAFQVPTYRGPNGAS